MLRIPPFLAPIRIDASRVEFFSRIPLQAKAKGFIVFRAPHKIITDNARRNRKLLVIQQVGSKPNNIKSDLSCRNVSMFLLDHSYIVYIFQRLLHFFNKASMLYNHI